jgi:hypothetical protein
MSPKLLAMRAMLASKLLLAGSGGSATASSPRLEAQLPGCAGGYSVRSTTAAPAAFALDARARRRSGGQNRIARSASVSRAGEVGMAAVSG